MAAMTVMSDRGRRSGQEEEEGRDPDQWALRRRDRRELLNLYQ